MENHIFILMKIDRYLNKGLFSSTLNHSPIEKLRLLSEKFDVETK